jgi:predicted nucleic acid-binding protein
VQARSGDSPVTLLDACAVISLYATRRMREILAEIDGPVAVVELVVSEALYVRRGGTGDDARELEPIDLMPLITAGTLSVIAPDDEEDLQTFIDFTARLRLDDGEAMTAAIAMRRGYAVVTDDRKVEKRLAGSLELRSTLDVIKVWAERRAIDILTLRQVLTDVRDRRSYVPSVSHPLRPWWDQVMEE